MSSIDGTTHVVLEPLDFLARLAALVPRPHLARVIGFQISVGLNQVPAMAGYLADEFFAAGFPEGNIHVIRQGEFRGAGVAAAPTLFTSQQTPTNIALRRSTEGVRGPP